MSEEERTADPDAIADGAGASGSHAGGSGTAAGSSSNGDISFVQRLQRHFGRGVDPEINLQREDEPTPASARRRPPADGAGDEDSGDSSTSSGLIKKLAGHVELGARFRIKGELARGGMGIIFRVWDEDLRRNLAMKVMHKKSIASDDSRPPERDQEKLGRFLEEAQVTGQLDHPGIVPVHDLGIDSKGRCYFTMRLVRGRELKEVFELAREGRENWSRTKVLGLLLRVCECMAFAHSKGVVHRDLKPQNVMVGRFGEVYVMDWGLARVIGDDPGGRRPRPADDPSSLSLVRTVRRDETRSNPDSPLVTMDGDVVGTPAFMAPEQARGKLDELGPRSDVYSLGAMLYAMLSGRSPYVESGERLSPHTVLNRVLTGPPEPIADLAPHEPPELIAICEKAMSREARDRYASMLDLAEDIQAYLDNRVVSAYEGGSVAEARKWIERNRGVALVSAALAVLALASAVGFAVQKQRRIFAMNEVLEELEVARDKANESARAARESAALADRKEHQARESLELARASQAEAERSLTEARDAGYRANILAADFSLRLDDVEEARLRLKISDELLREWEWRYLDLRTRAAIEDMGYAWKTAADQVAWNTGTDAILVLTRDGRLRFMEPRAGAGRSAPFLEAPTVSPTLIAGVSRPRMALPAARDRVALVGIDDRVYEFDVATREQLRTLPLAGDEGHAAHVGAAAYAPDGSLLLTGADDGSLVLWDDGGRPVHRTAPGSQAVTSLAWSPDGEHFAAGFQGGEVVLWERAFPRVALHRLEGHQDAVHALAFDHTGASLFSAGADGKLHQWSRGRGRLIASLSGHRGGLRALDVHPSRPWLATGGEDRTVRLWDLETGTSRVLLGHEEAVLGVAFSDDGTRLLSGDRGGRVKTWDARRDPSTNALAFHRSRVAAASFSPDGRLVATGDARGELVLWDAEATQPLLRLRGHTDAIVGLAFDPAGEHLYSASEDHTVRRWSVADGHELAAYDHPQAVTGLFVSRDGKRLVTSCEDRNLRVIDAASGATLREWVAFRRALSALAPHPGGELCAGLSGNDILLWNLEGTGEPRRYYRIGVFRDLAFAPDGSRLVAAARNGEVSIWSLDSDGCLGFRKDHDGAVDAVAFHPSGRRFASGGRDGTVRVREVDTGRELLVLPWPGEEVADLAFSPDGARLLASATSGSVRIWETDHVVLRRGLQERAGELRRAVAERVDRLFDEVFGAREVVVRLEADAELDPAERAVAVSMARFRGDDPLLLAPATLREVLLAGASPERYAHALARAEAALAMPGGTETPLVWLALGAARLRVGDTAGALAALETADERDELLAVQGSPAWPALTSEEEVARLAFLAIVRHARGRETLGQRALEEALSGRERVTEPALQGLGELLNEAADRVLLSRERGGEAN